MTKGRHVGQTAGQDRLEFGIVTGQHRRPLRQIEEHWRFAEETGWDSAWAFDHFFSLGQNELDQTLEGWTLLAALAAKTTRLRLGLMVNGNTHRNPAILAKQTVTVDHISNGRLILGMGAGWNEREHAAYGIDFPSARERVDRFGEALELMRQLETNERTTFHGRFYRLENAPFEPKPLQGHIPVLVGTAGTRMLRHVARYADYWDGGESPERYAANGALLDEYCREIRRDPREIRWVFSAYSAPLQSVDTFRAHVTDYARIGVRTFLFNTPFSDLPPLFDELAGRVIPELRQQHAAGQLV
jgi:alkanesulfonate monooxygenase SsuD/methylene tetrahydromethanopterin reductase-like flavin-dependent oxidoreductase (luciferase family)